MLLSACIQLKIACNRHVACSIFPVGQLGISTDLFTHIQQRHEISAHNSHLIFHATARMSIESCSPEVQFI